MSVQARAGPPSRRPRVPADPTLAFLNPGERAAITLALSLRAIRLLMDEWDGRTEAERQHIRVTGTLGVLADAHLAGLLDFDHAFTQLRQTNFYFSDHLVARPAATGPTRKTMIAVRER